MTNEAIQVKVNAIHWTKTVILSIGEADTVSQLIPYFSELIKTEDDEVLFAIAEELGKVFRLINDKTVFLGLLESLAKQDETVVREQAAKSLTTICETLSDAEIQNVFAPLVIKLAQGEWFTGRVSSCHLFFPCYSKSGPQKEKLRKKFIELCNEDTPMIRRACASKLGLFATQLEKQHVLQEILPIFRQLSQDEQDTIRVMCLESLIPMAKYLSKEENQIHTLGTLLAAGEDKSWKVRLAFAKNFAQFADSFGKEITDNNLIQTFTILLNDNEAEVKHAAITNISECLKNLSTEKICNLMLPTLQQAYSDATP
jgi:serine/threonine-protein phosphatase 2A regulatory subunit A